MLLLERLLLLDELRLRPRSGVSAPRPPAALALRQRRRCSRSAPPSWLAPLVRKHELDPKALSKFAFGAERTYARPRGR